MGYHFAVKVKDVLTCQKLDIPITDPHYWQNEEECNLDSLRHIFRSSTDEEMPLLQERLDCLRESGRVLYEVCPTNSSKDH